MNELINILEERYSASEIVELLNSIDRVDIEDYAINHSVCPKCYDQIITHKYKESRGECFGFPSYEEMCELICQGCGENF